MSDLWKHKKRGTTYEVLTSDASFQCSAWPYAEEAFDDDTFTVYRSVDTGAVYVRPTEEFMDGRFEQIPHPTLEGGEPVHRATESANTPIGQDTPEDAAP